MKNALKILVILLISSNVGAQSFPYMRFRKPTYNSGTYTFHHVVSGTNALVTVIGSRNASINEIDDSSSNAYAWNPFIRYGRTNGLFDTSYIDFRIELRNALTNAPAVQDKLALTVVDLDGSLSLREMVQTSLPSTPMGIVGSTITTLSGVLSNTFVSGILNFSSIDTNNVSAMTQVNYTNVNQITMRVGVIGRISSSTTRQSSFYFKPFNTMNFVLPVKLMEFNATVEETLNLVTWKSTSEENSNRFEIYRSFDGTNYSLAGSVAAQGYSQSVTAYQFADFNLEFKGQQVFYKLKMIDNDGETAWSHVVVCGATSNESDIVSMFPNPAVDHLNINIASMESEDFNLEVVDMFGKVVKSVAGTEIYGQAMHTFDLNNLNSGVYFVRVSTAQGEGSLHKFIKR